MGLGLCRHENHPVVFILFIAVALTAVVYKPMVIPGQRLPGLLFKVHMKIAAYFSIKIGNRALKKDFTSENPL